MSQSMTTCGSLREPNCPQTEFPWTLSVAASPCQDISIAGDKSGLGGARSGLWSEFARLIGDLRPIYTLIENVPNLLAGPTEEPGGWFGEVLSDLAAIRFDAQWHSIPASVFGAHFVGDRVWIIATPAAARSGGWQGLWNDAMGTNSKWSADQFEGLVRLEVQHAVPAGKRGRVSDGISNRVDRLRALGNAVNPHLSEAIGKAIMSAT